METKLKKITTTVAIDIIARVEKSEILSNYLDIVDLENHIKGLSVISETEIYNLSELYQKIQEYIEERIYEFEFVYIQDVYEYLANEKSGYDAIAEAIKLACEMGYGIDQIDTYTLANIHARQRLLDAMYDAIEASYEVAKEVL